MNRMGKVSILVLAVAGLCFGLVQAQTGPKPSDRTPASAAGPAGPIVTGPGYSVVLLSSSMPYYAWGVGVPPSAGTIYVGGIGSVGAYSGGASFTVASAPIWVTAARFRQNYGFTCGDDYGHIYRLNAATHTLNRLATVPGEPFITGLEVDPADGTIYFVAQDYVNSYYHLYRMRKGSRTPKYMRRLPIEPYGVSVVKDTLYLTDMWNGGVYRMPKSGGALTLVASGLDGPCDIVADGGGNLYLTEYWGGTIVAIKSGTGKWSRIATGFDGPMGIGVDANGNIYFCEQASYCLWMLQKSFL